MKAFPWLLLLASLLIYPPAFCDRPSHAPAQLRSALSAEGEVPTVTFCEMLKRPRLYYEKTVRLTTTYLVGYETAYLVDEECRSRRRDKVGVGFVNTDQTRDAIRSDVDKIMSGKYGNGRARVTVVGILRNSPDRGFGGYRYRFDIIRFEDISRAVSSAK